jgi:hypothetical protein
MEQTTVAADWPFETQDETMPGETYYAAGGGLRRPAATAIGHCLADMYDAYLRSPLPQHLTLLLDKIDEAEHARTGVVDPDPEHDPEKWIPVFGKDHAQTKI